MASDPTLEQRGRIARAADYIVENLARPLGVAEVAKHVALSEFHFHRMFSAVMGETVGEFTSRRRMELSALKLAYRPDFSITQVALESGYSSSANFSKAFSAYFGCAPSEVRRPGIGANSKIGKLTSRYGKDFVPRDLYALPMPADEAERERRRTDLERGVRYVEQAELPLACLRSPSGYDFASIRETWEELIARARQLGLCEEEVDAFGIGHDSPQITAPELCRYDACVPYDGKTPLSAPLFRSAIPAGRYAIFPYAGSVGGVEARVREIFSLWFPFSSVTPDQQFTSIDHYVNDEPKDGFVDMEMWFRIRPR
jgi:AraC family transcriptional regulator